MGVPRQKRDNSPFADRGNANPILKNHTKKGITK